MSVFRYILWSSADSQVVQGVPLYYKFFPLMLSAFFVCVGYTHALDSVQSGDSMQEMVKRIGTGKPVVPQLKTQPSPITPIPRSSVQVKQPTNQPKQPTIRNVAPVTMKPPTPALSSSPKNGTLPRSVPSNEKPVSLATKPASPAVTTSQMSMLKTTPALHKTYNQFNSYGPRVKAKAMMCVDCSSNKIMIAMTLGGVSLATFAFFYL